MNRSEERRPGAHEVVYRDVNESIERGVWPGEAEPVAFRCECARLGCADLITMSTEEYEKVRSDPRRFLVLPGHDLPEVETVVGRGDGYVVVEKRGEAGEVASQTDPRR